MFYFLKEDVLLRAPEDSPPDAMERWNGRAWVPYTWSGLQVYDKLQQISEETVREHVRGYWGEDAVKRLVL
jgi:hypothetical protein